MRNTTLASTVMRRSTERRDLSPCERLAQRSRIIAGSTGPEQHASRPFTAPRSKQQGGGRERLGAAANKTAMAVALGELVSDPPLALDSPRQS